LHQDGLRKARVVDRPLGAARTFGGHSARSKAARDTLLTITTKATTTKARRGKNNNSLLPM